MNDIQKTSRRRRSSFTPEVAQRICDRLMDGQSLRQICRDPTMPARSSIFQWLRENKEFGAEYASVKQMQIFDLEDEFLDTIRSRELNGESFERKKMRIQNLKWLITHLAAKKYRVQI